MKLKKRIYLLTPLLVLVCVIAAGVFMKAPAKVEAESYVVRYDGGKSYNDAQLLRDQIESDDALKERFEIKTFKTNLFDYNGDAYNAFSAFRFNNDNMNQNFFAFDNGNIKRTYQKINSGDFYWPEMFYPFYQGTSNSTNYSNINLSLRNIDDSNRLGSGVNKGGLGAKQGIMEATLVNNLPKFNTAFTAVHQFREHILFSPSETVAGYAGGYGLYNGTGANNDNGALRWWIYDNDSASGKYGPYWYDLNKNGVVNTGKISVSPVMSYQENRYPNTEAGVNALISDIRENTYTNLDFEFIYDKETGRYTYNSLTNHAQLNTANNKIELYTDTLSATNGSKSQMPIFYGDLFGDGSAMNVFAKKAMGYGNPSADATNYDSSVGGVKIGSGGAIQKTYYDWHKNSGFWVREYSVTGEHIKYRMYSGIDRFAPTLELDDFKLPGGNDFSITGEISSSRDSDGPNKYLDTLGSAGKDTANKDNFVVADKIADASRLKYIYIKFKLEDSKNLNKANKLRIVLSDGTTQMNGYAFFSKFTDSTDPYKFTYTYGSTSSVVVYTYDYTADDYGKVIELRIPIINNDELGLDDIEKIGINPYFEASKNSSYFGTNATDGSGIDKNTNHIAFTLCEFSLGYDPVESDKDKVGDNTSLASFLPLHKIQNSYPGENTFSRQVTWNTKETNNSIALYTTNQNNIATRAVSNKYYEDGLTGVGRNDYDGTAAHFGMTMEVEFFLPLSKQIEVNGKKEDIVFEFSGDDDLWVYVDDKLVLDLGGEHTREDGSINFTTGTVTYGRTPLTVTAMGSTQNDSKEVNVGDFSVGKHTLKIFYLERAAGMSNCYISFNLPQVPEGALTVSKEIKELEGSEIELPADFNVNGADESDNVVVVNKNGTIGFVDANGNEIEAGKGLLTYTFEAEYKVPKAYIESKLYDHKYSVYKTDNPKETTVNELNFQDVKDSYTQNVLGTEYIVYNVRFEVPVGYTATFFLPEDAIIMRVAEVDSTQNDDNVDYRFELGKTTLNTGNGEPIIGIGNTPNNNRLTYTGGTDGIKVDENTDIKLTFTNYYKAELYDLEIEKKFKEGDPVPVDQSILYTVECGETHDEGDTCDNPFCNKPLLISMVIKDTKGLDENPNKVIVKDLPKGNYKVKEKADWSWRYECYNVTVQRNDAEKYGDGTIISAVTPAPAP